MQQHAHLPLRNAPPMVAGGAVDLARLEQARVSSVDRLFPLRRWPFQEHMTHQASRTAPPTLPPPDRLSSAPTWGEVADLVRRFCAIPGRFGFRVASVDRVGHVFIAGGRVIHAEYGEDYGLDALMRLLRAGPLSIESWTGPWPRQGTLHLTADVLLGSTLPPPASGGSLRPTVHPTVHPSIGPETLRGAA